MRAEIVFALIALGVLLALGAWVTAGMARTPRLIGLAVALLATAAIYLAVGAPAAIAPPTDPIDDLASRIEQKLDQDPTDAEGWRVLGRLRMTQARYDAASDAYAKARALAGDDDAAALLGYAEARLLADPSRLTGEVAPLLERALTLAPKDERALWYGGHLAAARGDRALAEQRWRALLAQDPPPDLRRAVEAQLGEASAMPAAAAAPDAGAVSASGGAAAAPDAPLFEIEVTVAPALAKRVPADATMFVFIRAGTGRIPLLAKRVSAATLPARFTLSGADLLGGPEALAQAAELTAGARVSASGNASRAPGDLEGTVRIERGTPGKARVVIDTEVR